ncbi:MAG: aminotransferase class V-fold PLP-dependent enzyme [Longimicrobiales bacterium]|nr:aminotransferase class V-fold PLP-dependent enzyme [Longimicrobiales bacterium]
MSYKAGRHFLQLPGPTNTPERVLRAMSKPTIDHRGPEFQELTHRVLDGLAKVFKTEHTVVVYPASGSGAWEATLANTLSPGDRVVSFRQGFFAGKWADVARSFGVEVEVQPWDLRRGVAAEAVMDVLSQDGDGSVKAVLMVHNETSTGVTTDIEAIGRAMRESGHPAMLFVDAVSSLAATDLRHDEWGLDVTLTGSQKGLMLPPGLAMVAVSPRAMEASRASEIPVSYWSWSDHLELNARGFFPYTPATHLLYGLDEALRMLEEEGLDSVFARHRRFARATRVAVDAWGLENFAAEEAESSAAATAVLVPEGQDADALRETILERFDMSLGTGLGEVKGKVFRIGHLGDLNELMLAGTLAGVEMGLRLAGVPHQTGGVQAAMELLCEA